MKINRLALGLLIILVAIAAIVVAARGKNYSSQDRDNLLAAASIAHPTGTDALGRDRLVRVSMAFLISLAGAIVASAITTLAAAVIGAGAAFVSGIAASIIMLVCDAFLALPWLFLLMMVRSALPLNTSPATSATITFLVLASLGWPACARAVYQGAKRLKYDDWMLQGRAAGLRPPQLMRSVLPNLLPLLLPQFLICVPAFVMAEANLGALGLGISEPLPSWGGMLMDLDNSAMILQTRWVFAPVALLCLVLLVLEAILVEAE